MSARECLFQVREKKPGSSGAGRAGILFALDQRLNDFRPWRELQKGCRPARQTDNRQGLLSSRSIRGKTN